MDGSQNDDFSFYNVTFPLYIMFAKLVPYPTAICYHICNIIIKVSMQNIITNIV